MNIDVFVLARLGSSRLPKKHFKNIGEKLVIDHLIHRIKKATKIRKIIICTTKLKSDDELVDYLKKRNIEVFRGSNNDVIKRIQDAAEYYKTDIIIDVEGDKIYTDPKYIDIIAEKFLNSEVEYITGNDSLGKFNPSHGIHGIVPAGFHINAIKKMYKLKKIKNTETGYREFFLRNEFNVEYIVPEFINKFPKGVRLFLDYQEDLEMAREIFKEIGNDFDTNSLLKILEKKSGLLKIIEPVIESWKKNYETEKSNLE
ncbi:acylneuraminate cytidylyltransferase [Nitrosopumilus sp.]|jgi:spore coat polysaccharide biosynthesis protein SpsF|nr:acylneuraminate cytidylyltransferase [Nitrosopumilus sp.]|tara:strand:+ start:393 stop:1163 length:771 start_codon:yes stop_codon:yes gene_type:complete